MTNKTISQLSEFLAQLLFSNKEKYNVVGSEQSTPLKQILLQMESSSLGLGMRLGINQYYIEFTTPNIPKKSMQT